MYLVAALGCAAAAGGLAGVRWGPQLVWWLDRHAKPPGERQFTEAEVALAPCFRCGAAARFQWQCCADGNTWRPLCLTCDLAMNALVLEWMGHPQAEQLYAAYRADVTKED